MSKIALAPNASGTATFTLAAPGTNTDRTATLPDASTTLVGTDTTQTLTNKTIQGGALTLATAVASTSGTSIDFTGIPSWVKRITVMFSGVSTNGSSDVLIQLGTSGGVETTGYAATGVLTLPASTILGTAYTAGFGVNYGSAADARSGSLSFTQLGGNTWVGQGIFINNGANTSSQAAGSKTLSGTLDRIRITTVSGTNTFDAGTINIMYEG